MRKTNIYLLGLILLIYIVMFKIVLMKYFLGYINVINIIFFGLLSLWSYFVFGFQKRDSLKNYNAIQMTIIGCLIYYIIIYILGLFFGFASNVYSLEITNIIKNVLMVSLFYGFRELFRYMIMKSSKRDNKLLFVVVTLFITMLDIIMEINVGEFESAYSIFEFVSISVIPNIAINLLLSYLAYNFSYKSMLVFLMFMILPNYILPIFPNLGSYFGVVLKILLMFYCYYEYSLILEKEEKNEKYSRKYNKKLNLIFIILPVLLFVGVVSGLFKYHLFAIASDSMIPSFARGDAVLIEKTASNNLEVGDVLAFNYGDVMMVHRIVSVNQVGEQYFFKTKGDNNVSVDSWTVNDDMVYGKVIGVIKYIGIPSVQISELVN